MNRQHHGGRHGGRARRASIKLYKGLHAIKRAKERYGLDLTADDLEKIGKMIRARKGRIIEKRSNVASVWEVAYGGQQVRVLYSRTFKIPMTFMEWEE